MALLVALGTVACNREEDAAGPQSQEVRSPTPTREAGPRLCPLSGARPASDRLLDRPAVAVKIENNPVAYPLSGLEDAEIVYEELVEGGITRFLAIYHCTDSGKVGPVRSSRVVDPGIMTPVTRILGAAGGNKIVLEALRKARIVLIDEDKAGAAMRRIPRPGVAFEHTLFARTDALRDLGAKRFDKPPPAHVFEFGPRPPDGRRAHEVKMSFGGVAEVSYRWDGRGWRRFDDGVKLLVDGGRALLVHNIVLELHTVRYSRHIVDVAGNPSIEIADKTGRGPAILLRDGRAFRGRWVRKSQNGLVRYLMRSGEEMVLSRGSTWVELLPDRKGQIKGRFVISKH